MKSLTPLIIILFLLILGTVLIMHTSSVTRAVAPPNEIKVGIADITRISKPLENKPVIAKAPNLTHLYISSIAFYRNGEFDRAREFLKTILIFDPQYADAWQLLSTVEYESSHFEEAIYALKQVQKLKPEWVVSYHFLGRSLLRVNNLKESIANLEKGLNQYPQDITLLADLATAYALSKEEFQALKILEYIRSQIGPATLFFMSNSIFRAPYYQKLQKALEQELLEGVGK